MKKTANLFSVPTVSVVAPKLLNSTIPNRQRDKLVIGFPDLIAITRNLLLIQLILFAWWDLNAQTLRITPPTTDAANLGKYGVYPTELSSGLVKINVPLYTIKSTQLELPISISYHSSGIKVNDVPSFVGLGWSLNAGGVLTRSVVGKPDESNGFASPTFNFRTQDDLNLETDKNVLYNYVNDKAKGSVDYGSDAYNYYADKLSGSFVYDSSHQIVQNELSNTKIVVNSPGISYTIIADDGVSYVFDATEQTENASVGLSVNTSFYLSKIISADKSDVIYFDYVDDNVQYTDIYPYSQIIEYGSIPNYYHSQNYEYSQGLTYIYTHKTKILSKIRFSAGHVDFTSTADRHDRRTYRLSAIKIYDIKNQLKRTIGFNQDYFVSSNAQAPQSNPNNNRDYRLKLTSLDIKDNTTSPIESYVFGYNTSISLPPYWGGANPNLYYGQDLYGYFNGVISNSYFLNIAPALYTGFQKANRNVVTAYAQAAVLTQIQYPTKGRTKFYYESNTTQDQNSGLVGGLRIKAVDNFINSDTIPTEHTTYTYAGGVLGSSSWFRDFFVNSTYDQLLTEGYLDPPNPLVNTPVRYYTASSSFPLSSGINNGAYYQYITEKKMSADGIENGKVDYQYEYEDDWLYSSVVGTPSGISARYALTGGASSSYIGDMSWARGALKKETVYKRETDGSFSVVNSKENTYTKFKEQIKYTGTNVFESIIYSPSTPGPLSVADVKARFQFFDIKIKNGVKKLTATKEYADGINKQTNYFYDNQDHLYLTRKEVTNSKGEIEKAVYKYPQDKTSIASLSVSASQAIDSMVAKNMLANIIETTNFRDSKLINSNRTNYKTLLKGTKNLILANTVQSSTADNPLETRLTINNSDSLGNTLDLTRDVGVHEAYQWSSASYYPIAKVINAINTVELNPVVATKTKQIVFTTANNPAITTVSFSQAIVGAISFNIFLGSGGSVAATANYTYSLSGPTSKTGTLCISSVSPSGCSATSYSNISFNNLPAGNYTLTLSRNINTSSTGVYFNYSYQAQETVSSGSKEFYYEGFEDSGNVQVSGGHTGHNFSINPIVTWAAPNSRSYVISYWFKVNDVWHYSGEQPYSNGSYTMQTATGYDDIRIYPADAQMTTYTYDPLEGMTSQTDAKGATVYYEYDEFQRLSRIKDQEGNIIKQIYYHYRP